MTPVTTAAVAGREDEDETRYVAARQRQPPGRHCYHRPKIIKVKTAYRCLMKQAVRLQLQLTMQEPDWPDQQLRQPLTQLKQLVQRQPASWLPHLHRRLASQVETTGLQHEWGSHENTSSVRTDVQREQSTPTECRMTAEESCRRCAAETSPGQQLRTRRRARRIASSC